MKFKLNANSPLKNVSGGGKIFKFLDSKTKRYAIIGIAIVLVLLIALIVFSGRSGDEVQFEETKNAQLENNQSQQENIVPPPPPLDEEALEAFEKGDLNATVLLEDIYPIDDNQTQESDKVIGLDENLLNEFEKSEQTKDSSNIIKNVEQEKIDEEKILPVENNLSMSQRGISPEKIVETIDKISNAEFKCKCDCPVCPTQTPNMNYGQQNTQGVQSPPQNNIDCPNVSNGYNQNANTNNLANNGKARIEIRPDDMIIYLKAKQHLMSFNGKNLTFENQTYNAGDIFKGWWKVEYINNVYARFMDDLSGYAYNLRFLHNQGGLQ